MTTKAESWRFRAHRLYRSTGRRVKGLVSVDELVTRGCATWLEVHAGTASPPPATRHVGGPTPRADLIERVPRWYPASGVVCTDGARVNGHHGWVITPSDEIVTDCTWYGTRFLDQAPVTRLAPLHRRLRGTTLSLCTEFAYGNYGHVLYDLLPRIDLFERSGRRYDEVDQILCNVGVANRPLVEALGIPMDRIVWTDRSITYRTDRLLATTFPGAPRSVAPWAAQFLRDRFEVTPVGARRRLYIPRRGRRRISNEDELLPILRAHGFEELDPGASSAGTRAAFAAAEAIVGGHGAGLADIVFSAPGTRLMELVPTDHPETYYLSAANAVGADHRYMTTTSTSVRAADDHRARDAAVLVDVGVFGAALDELVGELD